jgi:hypothetical protein
MMLDNLLAEKSKEYQQIINEKSKLTKPLVLNRRISFRSSN